MIVNIEKLYMNCDTGWMMTYRRQTQGLQSRRKTKLRAVTKVRKVRGICQQKSTNKSVNCKILCLMKRKVALRMLVLVSSHFSALQTTLCDLTSRGGCDLQLLRVLSHYVIFGLLPFLWCSFHSCCSI